MKSSPQNLLRAVAVLFVTFLAAPFPAAPSAAQGPAGSPLWERWGLSVGGYFNSAESVIRADAEVGDLGTEIDFENDLGLDSSATLFKLRVDRLFGRRHELSLGAYDFERSGSRTIDQTLEFDGTVFPASATVSAELNSRNLELAYSYYLVRRERFGFGLSGGIVGFELEGVLAATVAVGDVSFTVQERAESTVPIPMIGARLRGLPHRRLVVLAEARFLPNIQVDDVDGSSTTMSFALEGLVARHLRLGVSYDLFEIEATIVDDALTGRIDWIEEGSQVYLRFVW